MGLLETTSLGLTSCLHRQLSVMSSEGEGQGRAVLRRRLGSTEKVVKAAEVKASGALTQEEKTATGTVSRVDKEGWRGWAGPQQCRGSRESSVLDRHGMQVKLSVFWDYAKAMGLYTIVATCLLYPGQSAAAIGANVWLSAWTNEAAAGSRQNNTSTRLGVYAALGILQGEHAEIARRYFPHIWAAGSLKRQPCLCVSLHHHSHCLAPVPP